MPRMQLLLVVACVTLLMMPSSRTSHAQGGGDYSRGSAQHSDDSSKPTPPDVLQPKVLPSLPIGMTIETITQGDELFHGRAGCFACHGTEGEGLPAAGDAITASLAYAQPEWKSIDSLITAGLPDAISRAPIAMPARGARGDLSGEETSRIAAYVWAISQTQGEPWAGGHASHASMVPPGSTKGTAQAKPWTTRGQVLAKPDQQRGSR